jgi:four helix bundle protein
MIADFSFRTSRDVEMFGNRDDWLERQLLEHARMTPDELKDRTKTFAVQIVEFTKGLPKDPATSVVTKQLIKSATGVAANYRAACRAKSRADFISKLGTTEEEADETEYWLTILVEKGTVRQEHVALLLDEADQLVRIIVASIKTARRNRKRK